MDLQTNLFLSIKTIILQARERVYRMANSALLETYWQIGKLIIEEEQQGNAKATLKKLANQLTLEFGKGFDERNLNNMRAFYNSFPIWNALRTELSWTHYRLLCRLVLPPLQLDDVSAYPLITEALVKKGYSKKDINKILGGNILRVLKANEAK